MKNKIIVATQLDKEGTILSVRFKGNSKFTSISKACEMAKNNQIKNAHLVVKANGKRYLRSNPDKVKKNNLKELAINKH